ncbi:hypothetical protein Tco_1544493, partial [Tanacetum coccineum]
MTITRFGMTPEAIEELINRRVEEALAAHEVTRAANALEAENQSQNGGDGDNGNGGNGDGENGNGENGNYGNGNSNENGRGDRPVARECTYQDFMKCQPLKFKGTEGVVGLISALTWWNSHKRTIGTEASFAMSRRELMKLMTEVMVAPVISISSDTSEESVPIVPADPIVTPEVGTVSVVSPAGVLDLVDYSPSSDFDPSEDSLPPTPNLPLVSPFLCSDDTKAN